MGNCSCSACCYDCCDDLCSRMAHRWTKLRPRLLDVIQMEDAEALRILIDEESAVPSTTGRPDSLEYVVSHREKIDARFGDDLSEMKPFLQQRAPQVEFRSEKREGLEIYVVTWNMNGKIPRYDLARLLDDSSGRKYDLYVIGLQEAPSSYVDSFFLEVLGESYCLVASSIMASLQLFVFVKITLLPFMSAHEGNVEARNSQYTRICQNVFARPYSSTVCACLQTTTGIVADDFAFKERQQQPFKNANAVEESDLVIWVGDLNYRVVGHRNSVGVLIKNNLEKLLWSRDQLSREARHGRIFTGFREGPLTFRPTYKYDVGTDNYDTSAKERVPSWTDRILFKVKDTGWVTANVHDYASIDSMRSSDHRPVKAVLALSISL
ncbi:hypothetical protein SELMODRAFT_421239 [Selaginella moellendorffii]|uniref:Inositol polyphosphate-related phosphatase domain-containing protein n=1 Tax=Selaginella moellendorffii TaxID=88036 RepID=D8SEF9_SELML|nr:hypothetical protein SELMODRAFT_421239 [Selaginella moellendorffii]